MDRIPPAGSYLAACKFCMPRSFDRIRTACLRQFSGTPVNLDTGKEETGRTATLVDLNSKDAGIPRKAWSTLQQLAGNGGYPDISHPEPPVVQLLPPGLALSEQYLYGTWAGTISLYPLGPVDMVLHIEKTSVLKASLEMKYRRTFLTS